MILGCKNLHIQLDVNIYQQLKVMGFETNKSLAALSREAILSLLKKYSRTKEDSEALKC